MDLRTLVCIPFGIKLCRRNSNFFQVLHSRFVVLYTSKESMVFLVTVPTHCIVSIMSYGKRQTHQCGLPCTEMTSVFEWIMSACTSKLFVCFFLQCPTYEKLLLSKVLWMTTGYLNPVGSTEMKGFSSGSHTMLWVPLFFKFYYNNCKCCCKYNVCKRLSNCSSKLV
jgi:hypothetical protein